MIPAVMKKIAAFLVMEVTQAVAAVHLKAVLPQVRLVVVMILTEVIKQVCPKVCRWKMFNYIYESN